eukprot:3634241-Ditylum_brightwellii.AAC.1
METWTLQVMNNNHVALAFFAHHESNIWGATQQKYMQLGMGYGELPPRFASLLPWNKVAVDLIGPWNLKVGGQDVEFNALTCIDPVTNLVGMICIDNKTAEHVAQQFENMWLAQYPCPGKCIHNSSGKFIGAAFQEMLQRAGVKDAPTTSHNPQANLVCKRLHQTVANNLHTKTNGMATGIQQAVHAVDDALATAMHATRCAVASTLRTSPGVMVFKRDMLIDLPVVVDLVSI